MTYSLIKQNVIPALVLLAGLTVFPLFPETALGAPTGSTLNGIAGDKQNFLNWTMPSQTMGTVTFTLKNGTTTIYTGTDIQYTHTGLTNGTNYTYTVTSIDSSVGTSPVSNTTTLKPAPPSRGYILDSPSGNTHLTDTKWCPNNGGDKNWSYSVKYCDTGGGVIPHFNSATSSFVVLKKNLADTTNGSGQPIKYNRYFLLVATSGKQLTLYKHSDGQHYITSTAPIYRMDITAEPNDDYDYRYNWTGAFALNQYSTSAGGIFDPSTVTGWKGYVLGQDVYSAQVSAVNVNYSSSWEYEYLNDEVVEGVSGTSGSECATWDLACKIGAAFKNLNDGFQNLVISIGKMLTDLWSPDATKIETAMNQFKTEWNDKLGFLTYPFTLGADIFNALTPENSWCSASTCTKNFGSFLGGDFTINFLAFKNVAPTIWEWVLLFIRATTVFAIVMMIKQKYMRVIQT